MLESLNQIKSVLQGIWNYRWTGLITMLVVGLLGALAAMFWPSKYEASARVYVDTQSILVDALKESAVRPNSAEQMAMVAKTLISRPNIERVMLAAQMNLKATDQRDREKIVDDLIKEIQFKAVGNVNNNLFTISYKHTRPETARAVVQTLVGIFVDRSLSGSRAENDRGSRFLDEQIKEYEQRLTASETALQEFKVKNMGLIPEEGGRNYVARVQELDNQIRQARLELRQAEFARDSVRRQLQGETPTLGNTEEATTVNTPQGPRLKTDLEERAETAEKRLDELRARGLTEEHPDVVAARRVVDGLKGQRERERTEAKTGTVGTTTTTRSPVSNPVYKELRVALSDAEAQVASQRAKVADYEQRSVEARASATQVPKVEAELISLNREYETNRQKHTQLVQSREAMSLTGKIAGVSGAGEIRVIDPPRVGEKPASPNRFLLSIGSLVFAIVAGISAALFRDQSKPTFFDLRALRTFTGMPMLGGVSFVLSPSSKNAARRDFFLFLGGITAFFVLFAVLIAFTAYRHFAA